MPEEEEDPFGGLTDDDLAALSMERAVFNMSHEEQTQKLLQEAGPSAAQTVINLAMSAVNENTRLNAARYIVDRVVDPANAGGSASLEKILGGLVKDAEEYANNK